MNLRLLGVGLTQNSSARLWSDAMPWTVGGLSLAIFSGGLLFSIDPLMYLFNDAFRLKMLFLSAALVFYYTMARNAAVTNAGTRKSSVIACISLGLWSLVPFGGIFIGFVDSKKI